MAKILCVAQQKGGAGKTTLVAQLATALAETGMRVVLVDTDPQATLTAWMDLRRKRQAPREIGFSAIAGWRVEMELARLARDADMLLVDTPPHAESELRGAIRAAEFVLVPCQPSPLDLWAAEGTLALARQQARNMRLLFNRVPPRGRILSQLEARILEAGIPRFETRIGNRQAYVASMQQGLGVVELHPRTVAAAEIRGLASELREWLEEA